MQKTLSILTFFALLLLYSCDRSKSVKESEKPSQELKEESTPSKKPDETYSYEIKSIEKSDDCDTPPCTEVSIRFPQFKHGTSSDKFNSLVKEKLNNIISDYVMKSKGDESIDELISLFMNSYHEFKESFPESSTPWDITADIVITYTSSEFISMSINTSSYTGGAHPNSSVSYLNITQEGKLINNLDYFFKSTDELKKIAEAKFRKEYGLISGESFSEKGFSFENDEFKLAENFGFTKNGIVFNYNPYEIASYAEGPVTISIPFVELEEIYRF